MDQNLLIQHDSAKSDINHKQIVQRIDGINNYFTELTKVLGSYNSKSLIVRDKTDELAKCVVKYSKVEEFNTTSKLAMAIVAELVAKQGDNLTTAKEQIESKILPNFTSYGRICKCLKGDIRNACVAHGKELSKRETYQTFKEKMNEPKFDKVLADAERDLENAAAESSRLSLLSQSQITKFEHKRLIDLKDTMETFLKIEISKHAKSLELFTESYKYIHSIDEDADLEALKRGLNLEKMTSNLLIKQPESSEKQKSPNNNKVDKKPKSEIEENEEDDDGSWNSDIICKMVGKINTPNAQSFRQPRVFKPSNKEDKHQKDMSSDSSPTSTTTNTSNSIQCSSPTENSPSRPSPYPGKSHDDTYHKNGLRYEYDQQNRHGNFRIPKTSRESTCHSPCRNPQSKTKSARSTATCNYYGAIEKRNVNFANNNNPVRNLDSSIIGSKRVSFSDEGWKSKNQRIHEEKVKHNERINSSHDNVKSQSTQLKSQNPKNNDKNMSEDNVRKKLAARSQFL